MPLETFLLGTCHPGWLARTAVPLFLSRRRLAGRTRLPRARGPWALDSGAFSELSIYGRWTVTPDQYIDEARRYAAEVGNLRFATAMDWMCEPWVVEGTGLSVPEHQRRTVENYLELRSKAPELPWVPVLQGWTLADYLEHLGMYRRAGVDLTALPLVGVGSICRRQALGEARLILSALAAQSLRLHAFGVKGRILQACARYVTSADSLAWSYAAWRSRPLPACRGKHARCNNCLVYALRWRQRLLRSLDLESPDGGDPGGQPRLFPGTLAA